MNNISASTLLADMQKMAATAQAQPVAPSNAPLEQALKGPAEEETSFGSLFKQAVDHVNGVQQHAGKLKKAFETGDPNVDLPQVMVASQKASIAFSATVEVRNKLLEAYKEVMSMSV